MYFKKKIDNYKKVFPKIVLEYRLSKTIFEKLSEKAFFLKNKTQDSKTVFSKIILECRRSKTVFQIIVLECISLKKLKISFNYRQVETPETKK